MIWNCECCRRRDGSGGDSDASDEFGSSMNAYHRARSAVLVACSSSVGRVVAAAEVGSGISEKCQRKWEMAGRRFGEEDTGENGGKRIWRT